MTYDDTHLIGISKRFLQTSLGPHHIAELQEILRLHERKYYVENEPVISDYEYDMLYKSLKKLESQYPNFVTPDSPTQRVGSDLTSDLPSVRHMVPMLSLDNSYDASDLKKFDEQVKKLAQLPMESIIEYTIEPKFDGSSISIQYQNDLFVRAATRGNGVAGEEITLNARSLPSIPLRAGFGNHGIYTAELRGEAVISKTNFTKINEDRLREGSTVFANPRNTASGGLRTKNPAETRDREIEVFIFQMAYAGDADGKDVLSAVDSHRDQLSILKEVGFKVIDEDIVCRGIDEVIRKTQIWESKRDDFPYEIDGMVVKVNSRKLQDLCGSTQHHPRWAIAYKFKAKQATTQLLRIEYQVGKIGSITPVAKVEPVHLAGVTVSSISLHNEDFIRSKDLKIGDQILVERAGDVIPYVVKSLPELRTGQEGEITFPEECPINQTGSPVKLVKESTEAAWRCPRCVCGAQDLQRIIFHVSKNAMDIDGLGKSYVEKFFELGWIKDISDVYNLDYQLIANLEGFGVKSSENLKNSIEKAKKSPLSKLLVSLSIHHLGQRASKILAEKINSVFDLSTWTFEDFTRIKDIGPVVAKNVMEYFKDPHNLDMLLRMEKYGVNVKQLEEDKPVSVDVYSPVMGKTILFTGSLNTLTRKEAQNLALKSGAKPLSAVSSNLDILVVGENAGSKLKKAQALGTVKILSEKEFIDLLSEEQS